MSCDTPIFGIHLDAKRLSALPDQHPQPHNIVLVIRIKRIFRGWQLQLITIFETLTYLCLDFLPTTLPLWDQFELDFASYGLGVFFQ